jgi:hypothetical protein
MCVTKSQSCLTAVTAVQAVYDEFLSLGGFPLLSPLLTTCSSSQELLHTVLTTLLEASCVHVGVEKFLLYPDLVSVCLKSLALMEPASRREF